MFALLRDPANFPPMVSVQYERGVYLPNEDIWLDPWDAKPFAFVSHAHSDHIAPHEEIVVSERTSRLMQARLPGERREHVLPFGIPKTVRGLEITLLPAGHIFGSAQFCLQTDVGSLLYTGDFKLRPGLSAEAAQWQQADTLVMLIAARNGQRTLDEGMELLQPFVRKAGIDPATLSLSDGRGNEYTDLFTPRTVAALLRYLATRPDFPSFFASLPVFGVDGTETTVVPAGSPAVIPIRCPGWHQPSSRTRRAASAMRSSVTSMRRMLVARTPHMSPHRRTVSRPGDSARIGTSGRCADTRRAERPESVGMTSASRPSSDAATQAEWATV